MVMATIGAEAEDSGSGLPGETKDEKVDEFRLESTIVGWCRLGLKRHCVSPLMVAVVCVVIFLSIVFVLFVGGFLASPIEGKPFKYVISNWPSAVIFVSVILVLVVVFP